MNNQNTEIPSANNQDGTNDPSILPTSTANADESTHTKSTHSLLIPSLTDIENLVNQVTLSEKKSK